MPSTRRTEQSIFLKNAVCHVRTSVAGSRVVPSIEWGGRRTFGSVRARRFIACSRQSPAEVNAELHLKTQPRIRDDQSVIRTDELMAIVANLVRRSRADR